MDHVGQLPLLAGAYQKAAGGITLVLLEEVGPAAQTQTLPRESLQADWLLIEIDDKVVFKLLVQQIA